MQSLESRPLGAIAAELPGATAIFRRYKLDFCCGGEVALCKAARAKGIPLNEIVGKLNALDASAQLKVPNEVTALIHHIVTRYHSVHREELPELVRLAHRVEARHAGNPLIPIGLADALQGIREELEEHMLKEETILFPMMRLGGNPLIGHPIGRLRAEHQDHGERLRHVESLMNFCQPPADACNSWMALYAGTRKFIDDVMQHIHLENNLLFPQFAVEASIHPVTPR